MSFCPNSLEKLAETMSPSDYVNLSKWIKKSIYMARSSGTPFGLEYSDCGYDEAVCGVLDDAGLDDADPGSIVVEEYSQEDSDSVWEHEEVYKFCSFF